MSCPPRFTQQQVIDALIRNGGLKGATARALHCNRLTVARYIKRYPAVKEAQEDAIGDTIDTAQAKLVEMVEQGDWRAVRYMLSTLGKDRGFTERQEIVAADDPTEALRRRIEADIIRVYGNGGGDDDDEEEYDEEEDE